MNYIISEYKVLQSAAGYYIGRLCHEGDGFWMPYDRASGYYRTEFEANEAFTAYGMNTFNHNTRD